MMKAILILSFLAGGTMAAFRFKNCDKVSPLQISITNFPQPFLLKGGSNFTVSAGMRNSMKLPDKLKVDVDLWRKLGFWIKIPCISGAGSCDYDVGCSTIPQLCQFREMCKKCAANIENITLQLPKNLSVSVPSFLVNGHYCLKADILNGYNKARIGCFELYFDIKKP